MTIRTLSITLISTIALTQLARAETPADTFKAKCAMCHAANGSGNTPAGKAMKATDFHDAALLKASDADLIAAITKGKGKMPAYGTQYSADQIKGLVAHVRELQKTGK